MRKLILVSMASIYLSGCASMFDKPHIVTSQSSTHNDRIYAWSSSAAAAIGVENGKDRPPSFCVLGAAYARTGSTAASASTSIPQGRAVGFDTSGTAGALLIRNEGQTVSYLDLGLFQLCLCLVQGFISEQTYASSVSQLIGASVEVSKSSVQFASVASLQPNAPTTPANNREDGAPPVAAPNLSENSSQAPNTNTTREAFPLPKDAAIPSRGEVPNRGTSPRPGTPSSATATPNTSATPSAAATPSSEAKTPAERRDRALQKRLETTR